jgi:aminoglycoside phosphotransferase (APT) family kinase protein
MIPEAKSAGVARALQKAFGVTSYEQIHATATGPGSDLIFRIIVKSRPYLLRIIMQINEQTDPQRQFTCLRAAAEAGLAPRVWYAGIEDGISITDFIEPLAFPMPEALVRILATLRRLHSLPRFPKEFNYVTAHKGFIWRFRGAGLLPKGEIEEVFSRYEQICAAYPRTDADMVSCHNDLKPENILFDGERVWLLNWQAAFVNDRYFDLAIVANFVVTTEGEEHKYMEQYFGRPADDDELARFFLMRQVMHMFYATVFLLLGSAGKPISMGKGLPSFGDLHRQIWTSGSNLADNDFKVVYGSVHWKRLLENLSQPRFGEAIRIVSDRHAGGEAIRTLLPIVP